MMSKLIKKEFVLSMHPTVPLMLLLSAMVMIPNYPYMVMFFYVGLALFFTCLSGRENHDILYTMSLPVAKRDIVRSRMLFFSIIELISVALSSILILICGDVNATANAAGMDANFVLIGQGLVLYGVFNLIFCTAYYKNTDKVGIPFVKASVAMFLLVAVDIVCCYAVPYVKTVLDTPGFVNLLPKLMCVLVGAVAYGGLTAAAFGISVKRFEKMDIV